MTNSKRKVKVRYWRHGGFFGWIHNYHTDTAMLELSLHSKLKLIRRNLKEATHG